MIIVYFIEDDWEIVYRKLVGIGNEDILRVDFDDWFRKKGFGLEYDDFKLELLRVVEIVNEDDFENELDREEVLFDFFIIFI